MPAAIAFVFIQLS